jgi:hypothetical protein
MLLVAVPALAGLLIFLAGLWIADTLLIVASLIIMIGGPALMFLILRNQKEKGFKIL